MPAITPLSSSKEKDSSLAMLWEEESKSNEKSVPRGQLRRCVLSCIFNSTTAQYAKLTVLLLLGAVHLAYMNEYLVKFAAFEQLSTEIELTARGDSKITDVAAVSYVMRALVDYKKNLWMTVGAMCASLASTASLLLLVDIHNERSALSRMTTCLVRLFDLAAFLFIALLLLARIPSAMTISHMTAYALKSAAKLVSASEFVNELSCTIEARDTMPVCSQIVIDSIFPVKVIEYLVILCVLTGAYIALAYLIEWCIRHFFPPSNSYSRVDPVVAAITRDFSAKSKPMIKSPIGHENNILIRQI